MITLDEVLHDSAHELGVDPGLVKDGVEAHLQELLAEHVETLGAGWRLVRREYPTADRSGRPALPRRDRSGRRRRGQEARRDRRGRAADPLPGPAQPGSVARPGPRACFAAQQIRPQARCSPPTVGSPASRSTTTRCAASTTHRPAVLNPRGTLPGMAREIATVGVVGLGTMGAGIAEVFARTGLDGGRRRARRRTHSQRGRGHIEHSTGRAVRRGQALRGRPGARCWTRITFTTDLDALAGCRPGRRGGA